jgi:hypothetical protein
MHGLRYFLASFVCAMFQRTSAWTGIDSIPRSGPISRPFLLAGKALPSTGLNSMRGWRTMSHATGVPRLEGESHGTN